MDGQTGYMTRSDKLRGEWAQAALEITQSKTNFDESVKVGKPAEFSGAELAALNEQKKPEADLVADFAMSAGSFTTGTMILETLLDTMGLNKKRDLKDPKGEKEEIVGTAGTSNANKREARKQAPILFRKVEDPQQKKLEQKPKSQFEGLMDNPDSERVRQENLARQRALMASQKSELDAALKKQSGNTQAQRNILAASKAYENQLLKLERMGLVPKGMYSGPQPKSPYNVN